MAHALEQSSAPVADYGYLEALTRQHRQVDEIRALFKEHTDQTAALIRNTSTDFRTVAQSCLERCNAGETVESDVLDALVDGITTWESTLSQDQDELARALDIAEQAAREENPAVLPVLAEAGRELAGINTENAEICRDARWTLMAVRARCQPGAPVGPIQGQPMDLDAYERSLG
ncbi:hypothetical protein [Rhodospira trueperi]|uniref:Uncharacterized protein n=1 Tax=Rhodospira trueperi TaxID=69960 RepID=A0A1G7CRV6_9PROT|nr:hypothetical protein [Rhodospira trueperi]SDE41235.1 hypothetical protein SAMN05421720_106166 [Rhodospira trueperi]